jgi:hypothetical protein
MGAGGGGTGMCAALGQDGDESGAGHRRRERMSSSSEKINKPIIFHLPVTVVGNLPPNPKKLGFGGAPIRYSTKTMKLKSAHVF